MNPKDVVFWPGFSFDDGKKSDKLLVIVGARGEEARLLLKTTSQPSEYRPDQDGCHAADSVFRFKGNLGGFDTPTWVQFDPPFIYGKSHIRGEVVFSLKDADLAAIINCYKKSQDIAPELLKFLP